MPDASLIRAAQAGDALALARLVDALAPRVARICAPIALDSAADAAQEALIQVLRDLRQLRDPAALFGWVRRIAIREAIRRARRDRAGPDSLEGHASLPTPSDVELRGDVRRVLASLAPEQRAILVLRDIEGLSEDEAAEQLAVARGTVKSRLHRARAAFRERWNR